MALISPEYCDEGGTSHQKNSPVGAETTIIPAESVLIHSWSSLVMLSFSVALVAGEEYDLTDDIAGIAAGGQILMGPKTFQR